jgi:hypothetical protein
MVASPRRKREATSVAKKLEVLEHWEACGDIKVTMEHFYSSLRGRRMRAKRYRFMHGEAGKRSLSLPPETLEAATRRKTGRKVFGPPSPSPWRRRSSSGSTSCVGRASRFQNLITDNTLRLDFAQRRI